MDFRVAPMREDKLHGPDDRFARLDRLAGEGQNFAPHFSCSFAILRRSSEPDGAGSDERQILRTQDPSRCQVLSPNLYRCV